MKKITVLPKNNISSRRFTRSKFGNFAFFLIIFAAGLFSALPLIYAVLTSFKPIDELMLFPPRFLVRRPTITNYLSLPDLLSNLNIPLSRYIFNSIFVALVTTVLYILSSSLVAYALSKGKFKGRNIYFIIIQFALIFNTYTLSIPSYIVYAKLNLIDTYWIYILPHLASTLGVFLMKQYIESYVPDALIEAAKIDGANAYRVFWNIVMPTVKPAWLTLLLFGFRDIWTMVPNSTVFTEQIKILPMITTQIVSGGIARSGNAMAMTVIMMVPPIVIYLISQGNVREAMTSAGIKE